MALRLALRPYQEEALARIADAEQRGVRAQLGVAATGLGKQQPLDEPVLTPGGWRTMGELRPGDEVVAFDGKPATVLSVHPQGVQAVMRVTFRDGSWVRCGPEHLWATRSKHDLYRGRPWRVLPTDQLTAGWHVPVAEPVHHTEVPLPIDPYTLGVLLGDGGLGTSGSLTFSTDRWITDRLGWPSRPHATSAYTAEGRIADAALVAALRTMGLWGRRAWEKHVPPVYLLGTPADRLALLRGLMDTDGHPMATGGAEFCSTAEPLAAAVADLTRSLGGVARGAARRVTSYTYNGERRQGRPSWRVNVKLPAGMCPFLLPRKAAKWVPPTKYPPARIVAAVAPDGPPVEQVCIRIDRPDGLYLTRDYVVTHNTVIFCALAQRRGGRSLVLAHRDELVTQAAAKVLEVWPELGATPAVHQALRAAGHVELSRQVGLADGVGICKAAADDVTAQVVVASVQTLARARRLEALTRHPFDLVVVDEAHHSAADTYRRVLGELHAGAEDGPLLLGVTATPDRGDGKGLDHTFSEIVFSYDVLWGIRSGYLADLRGVRVKVEGLDLGGVKVSRGDYDQGQVGQVLEDAQAELVVVRAWKEHAADRRTLIFTPTVEFARRTAEAFQHVGVQAGYVHGGMPMDERRAHLAAYDRGDMPVLVNCMVLTEGFDAPRTDCVVVARPTRSRGLYTQMVGRGTRRHPEKQDCLVLDVVGASAEHSLVTVPSLFGVEGKWAERLGAGTGGLAAVMDEWDKEQVRLGRLRAEDAELFHRMRREGIAWITVHEEGEPLRRYVRPLGQDEHGARLPTVVLAQRQEGDDCWTAGLHHASGRKEVLIARVAFELAQGVAEDYVRRHAAHPSLVKTDARWRKRKPTPRQLAAAKRWKLKVDPKWSAGDLSEAMDAHIARIQAKRQAKGA